MIIREPWTEAQIKAQRAKTGTDRYDEVWDGVYIVSPLPNDEHQDLVGAIFNLFFELVGKPKLGLVRPGVNVSDRDEGWNHNYREPDVAVFLKGTKALNRKTHWVGGPDFAVEILSHDDTAREKLDFYGKVGVRELLVVDRDPWGLELYRLGGETMGLVGRASIESGRRLESHVLPLSFGLIPGDDRPVIEAIHADGEQHWSI